MLRQLRRASEDEDREIETPANVPVRVRWRLLGAGLAGLAMAVSILWSAMWPGAILGIALFLLSIVRVPAGRAGLRTLVVVACVTSVAFCGVLVHLLLLPVSQGIEWYLVVGAVVVTSAVGAIAYLLLALAVNWVRPLPFAPFWIAGVWVLWDAVWGRSLYGLFGAVRLGLGQIDAPTAGLAALGGVPLISFVLAFAGALLATAVAAVARARRAVAADRHRRMPEIGLAAGCLLLAMALIYTGSLVPRPSGGQPDGGPSTARIALIQGSEPGPAVGDRERLRQRIVNHVRVTLELAAAIRGGEAEQPDAVIWPEDALNADPFVDAGTAQLIDRAANEIGVPILVGARIENDTTPPTHGNVGIVWNPGTGPAEIYRKQHLMPFGEFTPLSDRLRPLMASLAGVALGPENVAGDQAGLLQLGPVRLADGICFEVAFDAAIREGVVAGGRFISFQSNNAGRLNDSGWASAIQARYVFNIARLRAVEHGRAVGMATTTGVTGMIGPEGSVTGEVAELQPGWVSATVPLRDTLTPADRLGSLPELLLSAIGVLGLLLGCAAAVAGRMTRPPAR